jgi:hypothetical protein
VAAVRKVDDEPKYWNIYASGIEHKVGGFRVLKWSPEL